MKRPFRILVRGVNWLGDAVMTTPALMRLREAHPDATIALLTPDKLADLWKGHPAVDQILPFAPGASAWSVGRRLRAESFDVALVLPNSPRSALECYLARIPRRVGLRRAWRSWMLTDRIAPRAVARPMHKPSPDEVRARLAGTLAPVAPIAPQAHHTLDYLHLAAVLGADPAPLPPRLVVSPDESDAARTRLAIAPDAVWLGLNPGAEYGPAKRWPAERFASAADAIARRTGVRWLLFGGGRDRLVTAEIARTLAGSLDLAGMTTLRELMALLASCRVVLTNDTGPMHVAAALGVPVVVPFGSTSPELTGPGMPGDPRHRDLRAGVACAPCFLKQCPVDFRCMTGISTERVAEAVVSAFGATGPAR